MGATKLMALLMFQKRMLKEVDYHHVGSEDRCTKYAQRLVSTQMRRTISTVPRNY